MVDESRWWQEGVEGPDKCGKVWRSHFGKGGNLLNIEDLKDG